jgi:hypothetical protein
MSLGSLVDKVENKEDLGLYMCVQTGSGAHPASYPMSTTGHFLEGKAAGA